MPVVAGFADARQHREDGRGNRGGNHQQTQGDFLRDEVIARRGQRNDGRDRKAVERHHQRTDDIGDRQPSAFAHHDGKRGSNRKGRRGWNFLTSRAFMERAQGPPRVRDQRDHASDGDRRDQSRQVVGERKHRERRREAPDAEEGAQQIGFCKLLHALQCAAQETGDDRGGHRRPEDGQRGLRFRKQRGRGRRTHHPAHGDERREQHREHCDHRQKLNAQASYHSAFGGEVAVRVGKRDASRHDARQAEVEQCEIADQRPCQSEKSQPRRARMLHEHRQGDDRNGHRQDLPGEVVGDVTECGAPALQLDVKPPDGIARLAHSRTRWLSGARRTGNCADFIRSRCDLLMKRVLRGRTASPSPSPARFDRHSP